MPDPKNETAFVLPADAFPGSTGPVHFGGFPGVFTPGQPIAVSELGFDTVAAARDAQRDLVPELNEKSVPVGSAKAPEVENHVPLAATPAEAEEILEEALEPPTPVEGVPEPGAPE